MDTLEAVATVTQTAIRTAEATVTLEVAPAVMEAEVHTVEGASEELAATKCQILELA